MRTYTQAGVAYMLEKRLIGGQTLKALAKESGISAGYLSSVIALRCEPGPKVLRFLGLKRERVVTVTYFEAGNGRGKGSK